MDAVNKCARDGTEDREDMRRNDTGKNYLAIRNIYRLTPNITGRDSPTYGPLVSFCGVYCYGTYAACLAVCDLSEETNRQSVNADEFFGVPVGLRAKPHLTGCLPVRIGRGRRRVIDELPTTH